VLLADPASGAVAAVHAGWRGVVAGVVEAAVTRLAELGAKPSDVLAAIGPHISLAAFEVSEDVAHQLEAVSPEAHVVDRTSWAKPHVDLRRIVRAKLRALGLGNERIDDVPGCTVLEPERFFSFRRDGARSGRHLSAIVAGGAGRASST
jgi:YfiH family protein